MGRELSFPKQSQLPASDLDGGGPGSQGWWDAPCADAKRIGREWSMKSLVLPYH